MGATLQPDFNAQAYYTNQPGGTSQFYASFGEQAHLSRLSKRLLTRHSFSILLDGHGSCDLFLSGGFFAD
jgi:hypothetical protein